MRTFIFMFFCFEVGAVPGPVSATFRFPAIQSRGAEPRIGPNFPIYQAYAAEKSSIWYLAQSCKSDAPGGLFGRYRFDRRSVLSVCRHLLIIFPDIGIGTRFNPVKGLFQREEF